MSEHRLTRRDFILGSAVGLGAAAALACARQGVQTPSTPTLSGQPVDLAPPEVTDQATATATATPTPQERGPILRIAHLTDMHVRPEPIATEGLARALRHAQDLKPAPDLVLNTGDCVMDSLSAGKEDTLAQWQAFRAVFDAECSLPVVHCIGNHDVWGWGLDDPAVQSDPLYGKEMALQQLGLPTRYFSYNQAGWHFIILDSTHPPIIEGTENPYCGKLDDEQYLWFENDLEATPPDTPVCVASHIPFLAACEYFDGPNEKTGNWVVPGAWMHIDARRMRSLFLKHPNVRLCLSGHAHQHERLEYLGVKYLCDGAVSGNWWAGDYMDFPPAYVVVDLFADGSSEHTFIAYDKA